jgi:hypothetical protein
MKTIEDDIRVFVCPLPMDIRGYTVFKDFRYTIVINENLCQDARMKAYRHERWHIENGDFFGDRSVGEIEREAHRRQ